MIAKAVKLVEDYYEANHKVVDYNSIYNRVVKWYDRFDYLDAKSLAALAIENPSKIALSDSSIRRICDSYFSFD